MNTLDIMYKLICLLASSGTPLVFKGGTILLKILSDNGIANYMSRGTVDIDADWVNGKPSMSNMQSRLNYALSQIDSKMYTIVKREYSNNKSAGFRVMYGEYSLFDIDISVRNNKYCCVYNIENHKILGATPEKIIADKIYVVSNRTVYRRFKDIIDLYMLSLISGYKSNNIIDILRSNGRVLGEFNELRSKDANLVKAYERFNGLTYKPPIDEIFNRVELFVMPFILKSSNKLMWNGDTWVNVTSY